ncbi:adhesion G protein-coupled receptor B2 [Aplysia californica]|uniref:Adhesion G protein-coupled receptor B2 n=1 Tax=Aplysia californica TaxID=6500 RepID=A0ABM0K1W7_APLCA|nr:adhesion G protein-coupled receptor B2 [Aplysia californica]
MLSQEGSPVVSSVMNLSHLFSPVMNLSLQRCRVLPSALLCLMLCVCMVSGQQQQQGHWGEWGNVSPCSVTCGEGIQEKVRVWIPGPTEPRRDKPFTSTRTYSCSSQRFPECPTDGQWSVWYYATQCTTMCGGGTRQRERVCVGIANGGKGCEGEKEEVEDCNKEPCPILPPNFDLSQCVQGTNFTCDSGKMCVPIGQRCDRLLHCHDGSDERNCTVTHTWGPGDGASFLQTSFTFVTAAVITVFAVLLLH